MRDLDLKSLRLFVAVCDERNIQRAAAAEHIEPSAISKRLAALEHTLGTALLLRSRRGVEPTPAGSALLEHARGMLYAAERIEADVASYQHGVKGHVRLVASASAIAESLLDDVAAFMREPSNRGIQVDIEERESRVLVKAVADGRASIGVCWDSIDFERLERLPYRTDELALAVPASHPLAGRRTVRFEQTLGYEHVGLAPTTAVHAMLNRAAARAGRSVSYRAIVSSFDAALRVVAAELGISVIPRQIAARHEYSGDVRVIALGDAWAARRFAVCFRSRASLGPAAERLVDYLVSKGAGAD